MSDADALQAELGAARRTRVDSNERHKTEGQWRSVQVDAWLPLNNAIADWQKKGKQ